MTNIIFYKNNIGDYIGFECSGHTGFGEYGNDILCASVSAIAQTAVLGVQNIVGLKKTIVTKNDVDGYLKLEISKNISSDLLEKCSIIVETAYLGLKDLESGYSSYIKIEEKR